MHRPVLHHLCLRPEWGDEGVDPVVIPVLAAVLSGPIQLCLPADGATCRQTPGAACRVADQVVGAPAAPPGETGYLAELVVGIGDAASDPWWKSGSGATGRALTLGNGLIDSHNLNFLPDRGKRVWLQFVHQVPKKRLNCSICLFVLKTRRGNMARARVRPCRQDSLFWEPFWQWQGGFPAIWQGRAGASASLRRADPAR